jgi:hypothetical protein
MMSEIDAGSFQSFLSHATNDHHFAARVRLQLGRNKVRSWIAEGELSDGCSFFEEVLFALDHCDALLVLVSSLSISLAWIDTEVETFAKKGKPVSAIIDGSDAEIIKLISGWKAHCKDRDNWLDESHGTQALSDVLKRYMPQARSERS